MAGGFVSGCCRCPPGACMQLTISMLVFGAWPDKVEAMAHDPGGLTARFTGVKETAVPEGARLHPRSSTQTFLLLGSFCLLW